MSKEKRSAHYKKVSKATSEALTKCWADPLWRARTMAKRNTAAVRKARVKAQKAAVFAKAAASFGFSVEEWTRMGTKGRATYSHENRRKFPLQITDRNRVAAKRHGYSLAGWMRLSSKERLAIRKEHKDDNKKNRKEKT